MGIPTSQTHAPNSIPSTTGALAAEQARRAAIQSSINPQQSLAEQLRRDIGRAQLDARLRDSRAAQQAYAQSGRVAPLNKTVPTSPNPAVYRNTQPVVNNAYTPGANYRPSSGIAAKNAAAAAGGTLAQVNAAARAATPTTVTRGALQGSPMLGAGLSGVFAAGAVKATGGSWTEAAFSGAGAAVGSSLGLAGGLAVAAGSLGTGNPFIAAGAPIAGQLGGAAIGGELGRRTPSVLGRIPGVGGAVAKAAGAIVPGAGLLVAGAGLLRGWLQSDDVVGPAQAVANETTSGPVDATGVVTSFLITGTTLGGGGQAQPWSTPYDVSGYLPGAYWRVREQTQYFGAAGTWNMGIRLINDGQDVLTALTPYGFRDISSTITGYTKDGQPWTPPSSQPPPTDRPRRDPYDPYNPTAPAASPATLPPATAPTPNNDVSQAPAIRPKAAPTTAPAAPPVPSTALPAGDPLLQPAPAANPTAATDPTTAPAASPSTVPKALIKPSKKELNKLKPGQTVKLDGGVTVTGNENGYTVSVPADSPSTVKLPNGDVISPGKTGTVTEKETNQIPWWALPFLAVPAGQLIKDPTTPGSFAQTPPATPATPKPLPPETGCRCNGPILAGQAAQTAEIADLTQRLVRIEGNQTGPTGFAGLYAFLTEMRTKLGAIGDFAETAWKATQMQKVLDVLTFIGVMHNVSMLSRNVGETFLEVVGQGIQAVGIRDEKNNVIDVNQVVSSNVEGLLKNILGVERYNGINEAWNKANRIISSASAIIWTVRSIADASQDLMEWIGENTGRIGNALKRWRVVGENAYPHMSERAQAQHRMRSRFDKVTGALENAEDRISVYGQATSSVLEVTEETNELAQNFAQFKTSVVEGVPDPWLDNVPIKATADQDKADSLAPNIDVSDSQQG